MNRTIKAGFAAFAIVAATAAFAKDNLETESAPADEGAIGWTPIAFGIASPVQLPWGHATWDVFGLDLNLFYAAAPKMYGLDITLGGTYTTDYMKGVQIGGIFNYDCKEVYGSRLSFGANISRAPFYGFQAGGFSYGTEMWGVDIALLGGMYDDVWGGQVGGLWNMAQKQAYGAQIAIGVNMAEVAYGCQIAGVFNMTKELHGAQIALINYAEDCQWGFQVGLINIIMSNQLKVLPFVNAYF